MTGPRVRRPKRTTLDPALFDTGAIGVQTAHHDDLTPDRTPEMLALVLSAVVDDLPEPDRSVVQMVSMQGLSCAEAARHLEPEIGRLVHKKTVWRWEARGLAEVERRLGNAPWLSTLTDGRVPLPDGQLRRADAHDANLTDQEERP